MEVIAGHNLALYGQLRRGGWSPDALIEVHKVYRVGAAMSYPLVRANWKPFVAHLVGTASIAAWDSVDETLIGASLVHSALEFGVFPRGVRSGMEKLAFLARSASKPIADLVGRYDAVKREPLTGNGLPDDPVLQHLRLANALDDIVDELGLVRTRKIVAGLTSGPGGLGALSERAAAIGAPRLAAGFLELENWPPEPGMIGEPRHGSFRLDRLEPSLRQRIRSAVTRALRR